MGIDVYAASLLEETVHAPAGAHPVFDKARAQAAAARIRELRKGVALGGLDDQATDRRRPSDSLTVAWCFPEEATELTDTLDAKPL